MSIEKILIVDDEILIRNFLTEALKRKGIEVVACENGTKAIELLKEHSFDLVITDMKMPGASGMDVLKFVKDTSPQTLVIIVTAFGTIENAVEAMKEGAYHYIIKPFSLESLMVIIEKANQHVALVAENRYLREQVISNPCGRPFIATSPAMQKILAEVQQVAKSHANVFINGETGTGKEVIAHLIHYNSSRANQPFIKVNCAAIPESLVESEFFGHEKGAFTGASNKRLGRFELAHKGSLLLDEITEIPLALQAKLLRVTQEMEFERVGGTKPIQVDVRLISTSNRNIQEAIEQKVLREDLYYRLNVVPIEIPPLRDRKEDVIPLAEHFIARCCTENHIEKKQLSDEAKEKLLQYRWPGNVRELANIIERAVVMDKKKIIYDLHLPFTISKPTPKVEKTLSHTKQKVSLKKLYNASANKQNPPNMTLETLLEKSQNQMPTQVEDTSLT